MNSPHTSWIFPTLLLAVLNGCAVLPGELSNSDEIPSRYASYRHCGVPEVRQSSQKSCGAAALSSVIRYWKESGSPTEKELMAAYPASSPEGYPLLQLRSIALREELLAFAVTLDENPMDKISEHLGKGRPIIAAVELPKGRYFGDRLPLIETFDSRTLNPFAGAGNSAAKLPGSDWKLHYVVVMGENDENLLLMDPQHGIVHVSKPEFEHFWKKQKYAALICSAIPEGVQLKEKEA